MPKPDTYVEWMQRQSAADGGLTLALTVAHEKVAAVLRNLPDDLLAVPTDQYLFATKGTDEDRRASVDAWAAAHHVTAQWRDGTGYCAKLACGPLSVVVIAAGMDAFPVAPVTVPELASAA